MRLFHHKKYMHESFAAVVLAVDFKRRKNTGYKRRAAYAQFLYTPICFSANKLEIA